MPSIEFYARNPDRALIDAAADRSLMQFILPTELELITVDIGDGRQAQVQALSRKAVRAVIERIVARGREVGVDLKHWICARDEFNLCAKLNTPVGQLMQELDEFLNKKSTQGGAIALSLAALFMNPVVGGVLTIFTALGFINHVFVDLCDCPQRS
jgi:hypothetical protein